MNNTIRFKEKVVTYVVMGFIIFIALVGCFSAIFSSSKDSGKSETSADGFIIEKFNIILDVKEDNKIEVTENVTVNWYSDRHHGIIRFVPQWLEYTNKNGTVYKRKSTVSNLSSPSDPYTTDYVQRKARIKIGDVRSYVNLGSRDYVIKYTYDMGKDPYRGFDEFIFHAFGDYWGTSINNPSLEIRMPKNIDASKIKFFTDKYRKNDVTEMVDYYVDDNNVIYASLDTNKYMKLSNSLTIDLELPEGYFVGGSYNYGFVALTMIIIIILLTIFIILRWYKYGRNFPKVPKTVEFYPPENMNAAEIGFIYNKKQSSKLTIALIVQLASKGYIKIDEVGDKKKEIQITNLVREPKEVIKFDSIISPKTINVKKLKDIDANLSSDEIVMMNYLFRKGDIKALTGNFSKFEEVKDGLLSKGYIEILDDVENDDSLDTLREEYEKAKKDYDRLVKDKPLDEIEKMVYDQLFIEKDVVKLKEHQTFYRVFNDVYKKVADKCDNLMIDQVAANKLLSSILIICITAALSLISFSIEDLDPRMMILYFISFSCPFINIFFTIIMGRKTKAGEKIKAQIAGFRDFLVKVEKDKLEALVMENPSYFYDILPYTYALNISKKWIKKFEDIPMPKVDMGNFDYSRSSSYSDLTNNIYRTSYSGSSSSGGCSSCGGGCSSCGGGCSSCGGGGSW